MSKLAQVWRRSWNGSRRGAEKLWRQLQREGIQVGCDRVARLMRELGIRGVVRGAKRRTTTPAEAADRPNDLVAVTSPPRRPIACGSPT
jgi:transposase InsO family protein